jgi:hyperosmotically inducible protein
MQARIIHGLVVCAAFAMFQSAGAQDAVKPDNTKSNQTDASNQAATPGTTNDDKADRELMQQVRKSLMADHSLSTYAHNVKIVASNGQVTLNGVVRSDDERQKVETLAVGVAGHQHVINSLKVAPANK